MISKTNLLASIVSVTLICSLVATRTHAQSKGDASIRLPITLESDQRAELYARIEAYVAKVHVDIGDHVASGQTLISLDAPTLLADMNRRKEMLRQSEANLAVVKSAISTALAKLQQADSSLTEQAALMQLRVAQQNRYSQLVQGGAVQQEKLDEAMFAVQAVEAAEMKAESDITAAQADVDAARSQYVFAETGVEVARAELAHAAALYEFRNIKAPFSGLVTRRRVDPGTLVNHSRNSMPLLVIENIETVRGVMTVPREQAPRIRVGSAVTVSGFSAGTAIHSPGGGQLSVSRVSQSLDAKTRTMRVEIDIANPFDKASGQFKFLSGQYGSATIQIH